MSRRLVSLIHIGVVLSCLTASQAAVVFVDGRASACGDGQSWATAHKYLQDALTAARTPGSGITEIWVATGTYQPDRDCVHPTGSRDRTATFQLIDGVAIRGGFAGTEDPATFNLASRNFQTNNTILSGDLAGNDGPNFTNNSDNSIHVVAADGVSLLTVLDGLCISGGNASGSSYTGGGMYAYNCSLTLTNCTFMKNSAFYGGGMYNSGGSPALTNCTFIGNSSPNGGAMYNSQNSPTLTNCTFGGNGDLGSYGGGMYNSSSSPTLNNCILWCNNGSQIYGSATVTFSCVQGGWPGMGNINVDPRFLSVAGGNLRLRRGSPCIDAGNNAAVPAGITTDLDGNPRFADDPDTPDTGNPGNPSGVVVDMGAYEYQPVLAERLYVNAGAAPGGNGQSWATAYINLQDALSVAQTNAGVTDIWVAAGTYKPDRDAAHPSGSSDRTATFQFPGGVTIYGGFPGLPGQEGNFFVRNPAAYASVLSGDLSGNDGPNFANNAENSYHVMTANGVGSATVLDGFNISGGNANGSSPNNTGGGAYVYNGSSLALNNCTITSNNNCGMYNFNSSPTLTNCTFSGNYGGGMNNTSGSPSLAACIFSGNSGWLRGAGMYNSGGNPTLSNCTFMGNSAQSYSGGGLYNDSGNPILIKCTFSGNSASGDSGGGFAINSGNPTLINIMFSGNWATYYGGGMTITSGSPILVNCTFSGNWVNNGSGGGISNGSGNPTLTNCTFSGNSSYVQGGGIWNNSGNPVLSNCILWGNSDSQISMKSGSTTVTYSCIQGGWPGVGNINIDPRLLSIPGGSLRLRRGSSCIDAGNNAAVPAGITNDLAGNPRFVDDPDTPDIGNPGSPPGAVVDMGAYEYQTVPAERLYVNSSVAPGGDGQNWTTAYAYLQDALTTAQVDPGLTEIWVAGGVYKPDRDAAHPSGSGDRGVTFALLGGVSIYGGFPGQPGQEGDFSVRNPAAYATVLSGDLASNDGANFANNGENSYHVVTANGAGSSTVLDGFTISGGNAHGSLSTSPGAGIYNTNGNPTISNCTFSGNSGNYGGGMYNSNGSPTLTNCIISSNLGGSGGGLYNSSGNPVVSNCNFSGNSGSTGGGLYNTGGNPTLTDCTFSSNTGSSGAGGGMYNASGNPTLINCTFTRNTAQPWAGLDNWSGSPVLTNCTFSWNSGGGSGPGSGMMNYSGNPVVTNCTFIGNDGSGLYNWGGTSTLFNCTIVWNLSVNYAGGGVYNFGGKSTVTNCIIWGNGGYQAYGGPTVTYSCVQGGQSGTGNINSDPKLMFIAGGNLRLRRGSPCIDAGNNAAVPIGITTDLAGNPRFVDDPDTPDTGNPGNPPGVVVDMGAYEYQPVSAERLYVNASAASGGNGRSWTTAFMYLQDAIALAQVDPGVTEIWSAGGVYKPDRDTLHPSGSGDRSATFQLPSGVGIYGGFPGQSGQEGDFSVRNPATYVTVLSGDLAGNDGPNFANNSENSYHVVTTNIVGPSTTFDGFTISGGNANASSSPNNSGGGMYNSSSSPTLNNCIFIGNVASGSGGGMYNTAGNPALTNCTFNGNSAAPNNGAGGAMYSASGNPALTNCTLSGNSAPFVGGMWNYGGNPVLTNCILWGNSGSQIYQNTGSATVTYSCVQGGWTGTGNISSDPKLMFVAGGNLRLRHGSPCIDAGNNAAVPAGITTDLDGNPRFVDDPYTPNTGNPGNPPKSIVDMGAYEYQPVMAKRLYVNAGTAPGGNGQSWTTSYAYLQDALVAAQVDPGVTEIWVAGGVYKPDRDTAHPSGSGDRGSTFQLPGGTAIYGGFPGQPGQEGNFSVRSPAAYVTVLSGDLAGNDGPNFANNGENSYHVVTANGPGPATALDGFTLSGGNANGSSSPNNSGGGMYAYNCSSATVTNCTFSGNSASSYGGGMYNAGGVSALTNCTFISNSGGGIRNDGGNSALTNCTFGGNSGGGFYNSNGNPTMVNCILWGNSGSQIGLLNGSVTVTYSCVQGGFAGTGNINVDPKLLANGNLRRGSPCIDAGNNAAVPAGVTADLAGNPRYVNDPETPDTGNPGNPAKPVVDMGAYEYEPVSAERLYVNASPPLGGNGQSWSTAYRYLQDALAAAQARPGVTEIWVAGGVYKPDRDAAHPSGSGDRGATFQLPGCVAIYGGFPGQPGQEGNFSVRSPAAYPTVLSGDLAGNDGPSFANNGENSYHVVTTNGVGLTAVLDGFTISGGNANGSSSPNNSGGGMYNSSSSPTLTNCKFIVNLASLYGGGMYNSSSNSKLTNCVFSGNATGSTGYGGGIYNYSSSPSITNCTFSGNSAKYGGGIYRSSGSSTLTNSILWGNTGSQIYPSGAATVTYSCVQGGWTGTGNINTDPLFVNAAAGDVHLSGTSPCIDAGDPASDYSLEPEPDGGRINMGAYGNTPEAETKAWLYIQDYVQVRRTRIGRTVFEYEFQVKLQNASSQAVANVTAELLHAPSNVQVIDSAVQVGTVPAGATVTSQDTFTIRVDRTTLVSPLTISWRVTYGGSMSSTFIAPLDVNPPSSADFDESGSVDGADMQHFKDCASGADIPPNDSSCLDADLDGDGDVDMDDFGIFQRCFDEPGQPPACP